MNFLPFLVLVGVAAWLRRKRECSAELCTCGCTVAPFDYAPTPAPAEHETMPGMKFFAPKEHSAPKAVGPIMAPLVPPDSSGEGSTGGGGASSGGTNGGSNGDGDTGSGMVGGIACFPEMCLPVWGGGGDWFNRYGFEDQRKKCCG